MAERQAPLLSFCQVHIRDKGSLRSWPMMTKTKHLMTLISKMYRLKTAQKNLNMNLNIHVMIHHHNDVNIEPSKFWLSPGS